MIKKNDTVFMLKGKDAGKSGKVLSVDVLRNRVIIEGINIFKKHKKPAKQGQKGEIILVPRGVHRSNVALYCKNCRKGVRVGVRIEGEIKVRICKRCKSTI